MAMTSETTPTTSTAASRWAMTAFGVTILLSAFLLFQVQPMVSKKILPWFGGCPAVWTTCMLFFQTLLFGGYVYAHLLQRWLAPRQQVIVHLVVIVAAMAMLPIAPGASSKPTDISSPTWRILLLLTGTVGLPYFALSATSPLVQAWFSRSIPGRSPYRLYALSNIGSLAALLSYPFLFEPALAMGQQSALWSGAFVLYGALCLVSLACLWQLRHRQPPEATTDGAGAGAVAVAPNWLDWLPWIGLPACASLMLLAATNHICQDVAVVPFLWILPLTLYLLSFIISFDHARWYIRPAWALAVLLTLLALAGNNYLKRSGNHDPLTLPQEVALTCLALFCVCMVCHGEVARLKPDPRHLTEFYLLIAAGGALGGLFVGIVAPLIFSSYFEWQIGVAVSAALAGGLLVVPGPGGSIRLIRYVVFAPLAVAGLWYLTYFETYSLGGPLLQSRNFFGVVSVTEEYPDDPDSHTFVLMNGRIRHGCQLTDPEKRHWPTTYYGENSGVGLAINYFQDLGNVRIGAIGLGVGTLASYAKPGDTFRFYEINPEVLRIATDGGYFTYLKDCRGDWKVVMGDARLSLESEPSQQYNVLVLDAFSGDAIPTHLLTREAFKVYQRHLAHDGIIAVHISNRHLLLGPVVRRIAKDCGMEISRISAEGDDTRSLDSNEWVLVTRNKDFLEKHPSSSARFDDDAVVVPLWTDDYSNLFQILTGSFWEKLKLPSWKWSK
jgi:hypothetical protein